MSASILPFFFGITYSGIDITIYVYTMTTKSVNLANLVRCTLEISPAQCTLVFSYC